LEVLRSLSDESIDCCVTSPPYWGLRDYGVSNQLGLEPTPKEYVSNMVVVFREVKRVLAPHGTCWLNLGDSYASQGGPEPAQTKWQVDGASNTQNAGHSRTPGSLKPKDLVGIPWRVAFALQDDGWWLRSDVIWSKSNPMPESITDRPTKAHEYVLLLTRQPNYYFDQEAVREPFSEKYARPERRPDRGFADLRHEQGIPKETLGSLPPEAPRGPDGRRKTHVEAGEFSEQHRSGERWPNEGRNIRSVWEIPTQPYSGAHFAVFPEELVRRCLLAGCPLEVCQECGKPSERIVEPGELVGEARIQEGARPAADERGVSAKGIARSNGRTWRERHDLGFTDCGHGAYRPGRVLDPFGGSGTTALVARNHQRHAILVELNEKYCHLAAERLQQLSLLSSY